jgi:hypothetical protein
VSIVARCVQNAPSSVYGMKFGEIRRQDTYPRAIAVIGVLFLLSPFILAPDEGIAVQLKSLVSVGRLKFCRRWLIPEQISGREFKVDRLQK